MESFVQHGPWRILARIRVYQDPWVALDRDDVLRPDGQPGTYCIVSLKPGVTVLASDANGMVYLTEEFHYGVGRVTLEAVSGGIDAEESAIEAARRELEEEIGITATQWTDLGVCDPFTASVVSPTRLFLAEGLTLGTPNPEGTEQIRCRPTPWTEAVAMVLDGRITHAPSCLLILKARLLRQPAELE